MPNGKDKSTWGSNKPVVLLQHGLFDSSWTWLANSEEQSLSYILANAGFDVWFGNNRGNRYGRHHETLDPDSKTDSSFWEFTWDEMASEDLPSMINFITAKTGASSISYGGHSEGTIQMFAASVEVGMGRADDFLEDAISKINVFCALAPVTYVNNLASKLMVKLAEDGLPDKFYNAGKWEVLPFRKPISDWIAEDCTALDGLCDALLMSFAGPTRNINATRMQVYMSEEPAGTSTRNLQHWAQGILSAPWQKMDWGSAALNEAQYGTANPPVYDISKLTVPTAFFAGTNDYLADPKDVEKMMSEVPQSKVLFYDMFEGYAHMDFIWGETTAVDVYPIVVQMMLNALEG